MWLLNSLVGVAVLDGHPPEREFLFDQKELGIYPGTVLSRMDIGPDGLKWMVGTRSGLALLDDGGTPFAGGDDRMIGLSQADESRLSSDRLFDVLAGRDGRVWLAAENGVNVITPEYDRAAGTLTIPGWQTYDTADGLPSSVINALEEDAGGHVWVGNRGRPGANQRRRPGSTSPSPGGTAPSSTTASRGCATTATAGSCGSAPSTASAACGWRRGTTARGRSRASIPTPT